jgi:hypothetical protein
MLLDHALLLIRVPSKAAGPLLILFVVAVVIRIIVNANRNK